MNAFDEIFTRVLSEYGTFKVADIKKKISLISDYEVEQWGSLDSGFALRAPRNDDGKEIPLHIQPILPDGQITESCPAPFAKIFLFFRSPNHRYISPVPSPRRGVAPRHERGAGCGGR
jgi:hypothetical protein